MTQRQIITQQSDILLFGKYKHCTIQHVLRTDPSYILWLDAEKIVKFPREIVFEAEDKVDDSESGDFDHNYSSYYDGD